MMGLFRRKPLLDPELVQWQFDGFDWLLRHTGGIEAFRQRRLILPTPAFFPHDGSRGQAFAAMIFQQVKAHAGMVDWPCRLESQEEDPDSMVSPRVFVQGSPASPSGTFRVSEEGGALITYNPRQLRDPMSLVATFAHELAHYRMAVFDEPPPGGWEVREPATDLAAAFLGFGIFLANASFHFQHFNDGQNAGWRWQHQGYLSDVEILHMHAMVSAVLGAEPHESLPHLKPAMRGLFKRAYREVAGTDAIRQLKEAPGALPAAASR